jgi:hypothetical protein
MHILLEFVGPVGHVTSKRCAKTAHTGHRVSWWCGVVWCGVVCVRVVVLCVRVVVLCVHVVASVLCVRAYLACLQGVDADARAAAVFTTPSSRMWRDITALRQRIAAGVEDDSDKRMNRKLARDVAKWLDDSSKGGAVFM